MPYHPAINALGLMLVAGIGSAASAAQPALTPERWRDLKTVQSSISAMPKPSDMDRFGKAEVWQVADPSQGGDCEDLALAARQKLLARGWPLGALRIAVGWTEQGEYHTVLSVDVTTKSGAAQTYILDGRQRRVESWTALKRQGYRWDRRQTANGGDWVAIRG